MRIGILTLPQTPNYGWVLQAFALSKVLSKMGHEPYFINRRWNGSPTSFFKSFQRFVYYNFFMGPFYKFRKKFIPSTRPCVSDEELIEVVNDYSFDAIVVGSDQVWRLSLSLGLKYNFFLDFLSGNDIKRISYAPSFGTDIWEGNKEETEKIKRLLKKFNAISVREASGVDVVRNIFDLHAEHVLDPTLLLSKEDYNQLLSQKKIFNKPTLATYILDKSPEIKDKISKFAEYRNLEIEELIPKSGKYRRYTISVQRWLSSIRDSEFVIIDSFHGMVFSLIFQKQFIVISNKQRGLTRFLSIAQMIGVDNNIVYNISDVDFEKIPVIDYSKVNEKFSVWKEKSLRYLVNALK